MKARRVRRFTVSLLLLATLLASCAPAPAPPAVEAPAPTGAPTASNAPTPVGPATGIEGTTRSAITFAVDEWERPTYEPLAERFMAEQPGITVQLVSKPEWATDPDGTFQADNYNRRLAESADSFTNLGDTQFSASRGYFLNLQPLIEADPSFDSADYLPGVLNPTDGKIGGLPGVLFVPLWAYNRELFAQRGVPEPTSDLSFAQLLERAQQLAQPGDADGVYGIWSRTIATDVLLLRLRAAGIDLGPQSGDPPPLSDPRYAAALAELQTLAASDGILYESPSRRSNYLNDNRSYQLIEQRRVGIWPAQEVDIGTQQAAFVPLRAPLDDQPRFYSARDYALSAGTQHPEAAWRWISFLSRQYIPIVGGNFGFLPARRSQLEQHWQAVSAAERAVMEPLTETLAPRQPISPNAQRFAVQVALDTALDRVLAQNENIPAALAAGEQAAQEQLASAAVASTPTPDLRPVVVATPQPAATPGGGMQVVRFGVPPILSGPVRAAISAFASATPDLVVLVTTVDGGADSSRAAMAARFDCFATQAFAPFDDATLDLQPLIDADPSFDAGDFPPALLDQLRQDGRLAGLPLTMDVPLLIYNTERFSEADLAPPRADWMLDDFVAAAEQLTGGTGTEARYGLGPVDAELLSFVLARSGVSVMGSDGQSPQFTAPAVAAAIERFVGLVERTAPSPRLVGYGPNSSNPAAADAIRAGQVAMWLGSSSNLPYAEGGALPVALAPLPLADSRLPGVAPSQALYISAQNERPEACWRWMQALSANPDVGDGRGLPARLSQLDAAAAQPGALAGTAELVEAYRAALGLPSDPSDPRTFALPPFAGYWLLRAIDRALQGGDLEQELTDAQFVTEQYLACVRGGEREGVCARQVDPSYDGDLQP
jgi:ABC-type glycerol-3-phosphate transport system substrate-binding protein